MDERSDMSQLSTKLAMARLRHEVGELESQVAQDRKLIPPSRKVFHCVVDDTALTSAIAEFKRWIQDGAVVVTVPLCTLDGLDQVKKGTDNVNMNSREAIRYFDRIQHGSLSVRGLSFQNPSERFDTWKTVEEEYMLPGAIFPGQQQQKSPIMSPTTPVSPNKPTEFSSPPRSPGVSRQNGNSNGNSNTNGNSYGGMRSPMNGNNKGRSNTFPLQQNGRRGTNGTTETSSTPAPVEPPRRIQKLLNCVLYRKHKLGKRDTSPPGHQQLAKRPEIHLITNSLEVTAWARAFDVSVLNSNVLEDMIEREDFIYAEKLKDYQEAQLQAENSRHSGGRGGRGGGGGRGGSRSGASGGGGGRNGHGHGHPTNSGSGSGRGHRGGGPGEPDFVFVREAPRGVARGKGKLWEP